LPEKGIFKDEGFFVIVVFTCESRSKLAKTVTDVVQYWVSVSVKSISIRD
jgi:G:T-mismatch repair DNA endonuclease (very short patch repair protein)